nr:MAG TPA: Protein of unknown function (DUF1289) [Caudoviricetes sp.]
MGTSPCSGLCATDCLRLLLSAAVRFYYSGSEEQR